MPIARDTSVSIIYDIGREPFGWESNNMPIESLIAGVPNLFSIKDPYDSPKSFTDRGVVGLCCAEVAKNANMLYAI